MGKVAHTRCPFTTPSGRKDGGANAGVRYAMKHLRGIRLVFRLVAAKGGEPLSGTAVLHPSGPSVPGATMAGQRDVAATTALRTAPEAHTHEA